LYNFKQSVDDVAPARKTSIGFLAVAVVLIFGWLAWQFVARRGRIAPAQAVL